jgi:DNA modification methylase
MAKIEIAKTELVWPGKYKEDGTLMDVPRVSLPFQIIETVNESRATREAKKASMQGGLFDVYEGKEGDTFEAGWRNKLIWGDNLLVMGSLLEKFAGKVDLIYIDPPFATGADFSFTAPIGESDEEVFKEQSIIEEKAYRDTWGRGADSFIATIYPRLALMRDLLAEDGSIYVHCDWRMEAYIRSVLEELFSRENFMNTIIWQRDSAAKGAKKHARQWSREGDSIIYFGRSQKTKFTTIYKEELTETQLREYMYEEPDGRKFKKVTLGDYSQDSIESFRKQNLIYRTSSGREYKKYYLDEAKFAVGSIWTDIVNLSKGQHEQLGYPTQKPEALLERIMNASSKKGDLVADFFCGSGTTLAVAEKLGRRWIGCDLSRWALHVTRKRLLGIENCKPFEVLNLGKYERQYWQGVTFGEARGKPLTERALYDYLAFILKLYGAQPLAGLAHVHGKKSRALVDIGAVDAPVTITEIDAAVEECAKLKQGELHVLGWEWEMGLYDLMVEAAKKKGVKLLLLQIPREVMDLQATAKGDVRFFELAYLEAEIKHRQKLAVQVALKDFVIPNTELIPEEVRSKVKKWSDYIDYWAVDWDFQNDSFMQGWVAYRTRKERKLPLASESHTYEKEGKHRILVKVIDIFGNDTSQAFDVEVK